MVWWIAQTACVSALLAALVAIVGRAGRLSPAVKHALWLLVLVKLMTPPLPFYRVPPAVKNTLSVWTIRLAGGQGRPAQTDGSAPGAAAIPPPPSEADWAKIDLPQTGEDLGMEPDVRARDASTDTAPSAGDAGPIDTFEASAEEAEQTVFPEARPGFEPRAALARLCAAAWLLGAIPLAVVQSLRIFRLRRILARSVPAPDWLEGLVRQVARQLNIHPPRVVVAPALCSPLVCALGRPRLLWPAGLSDQLAREAREAVLMHELAHLRRRDHWVAWLELTASLVWWFNPLYWYVRHQLRENAELACDAWVVGLLPAGRRAYAQALIEVTEFVSPAPAAMPAVAMGNVARRTLERRLTMIMRERVSYRVPLLGTGLIGLSLLAVLPGWSGGQESGSRPESPSEPGSAKGDVLPTLPQPLGAEADQLIPAATDTALGKEAPDEDRLGQLEEQLRKLQADIQALRAGQQPASADRKPAETQKPHDGRKPAEPLTEGEARSWWGTKQAHSSWNENQMANPYFAQMERVSTRLGVRPGYQIETLTRARYKLSEATANALASFIQDHVKSDVEARVAGDTLTVIASQEDQAKISAFIDLLGDGAAPHVTGMPQQKQGNAGKPAQQGNPSNGGNNPVQQGSLPSKR